MNPHIFSISHLVGGFTPPLKNISQLGLLFQIYEKIKNVPNHQPAICVCLSHIAVQSVASLAYLHQGSQLRNGVCRAHPTSRSQASHCRRCLEARRCVHRSFFRDLTVMRMAYKSRIDGSVLNGYSWILWNSMVQICYDSFLFKCFSS